MLSGIITDKDNHGTKDKVRYVNRKWRNLKVVLKVLVDWMIIMYLERKNRAPISVQAFCAVLKSAQFSVKITIFCITDLSAA